MDSSFQTRRSTKEKRLSAPRPSASFSKKIGGDYTSQTSPNFGSGTKNRSLLDLVGKGKKGKDCGNILPSRNCHTCLKWHFVKKSCMQKGCPHCYKKWVKKATGKIGKRLLSIESSKRLLHIVISPSPELVKKFLKELKEIKSYQKFYPEQFKELFQYHFATFKGEALKYLYSKGEVSAGCLIFHPFRPNLRYYEERKEERGEEDRDIKNEMKKWEWIRSKENWQDYVNFSPHFHFIGYTGWLEKPEANEDYVYKLIKNREGNYRGIKEKELFAVIAYLLSHACGSNHAHAYIWLGKLSYRNGNMGEEVEKKKVCKCKMCGGKLVNIEGNLRAFFKVWCNINDYKVYSPKELKKRVIQNQDIPPQICLNVLEGLDIIQTGKIPDNYEDYLVEGG